MKDRYIDDAERVRYTQHFISAAAAYVDLDPIVTTLINEQQGLLPSLGSTSSSADDTRADLKTAIQGKDQLEAEVLVAARREYETLYPSRNDGTYELTRFFPTGRKQDIGESPADLQKALERIVDGYDKYPAQTTEARLKDLKDLLSRFTAALNTRSAAGTGKLAGTRDLRTSRETWDRDYRGAQLIMHGLLVRAGREDEVRGIFLDMQSGG